MTYERDARRFIFNYSTNEDEEDSEWPADEVCLITEPSQTLITALSTSLQGEALAQKVLAWMVEFTPCAVYVRRAQGDDFSSEFLISDPEQAADFKAMWDVAQMGHEPR